MSKSKNRREKINSYEAISNLFRKYELFYSEKIWIEKALKDGVETKQFEIRLNHLESFYPHCSVTGYLPCYNQEKYIESAIQGLLSQSYPIDEILIIDDGSTDNSIELANKYPVKIIQHTENKGLSAARNTAIINCKSDFLATIDTDVVPDIYWLEYLMLTFNKKQLDGVGGRLIEENNVTTVDQWRQIVLNQDHGEKICENNVIFGSNTVFRLSALMDIDGYNVRLRTNFEDMDLSKRLLEKGFKTFHQPMATCFHQRTDSLISVVDTCYNWRKPIFECNGAFEDQNILITKGKTDIHENIRDLLDQLKRNQFHLLYISYISAIRAVLKNVENFNYSESLIKKITIESAYIYLFHLLIKSKKLDNKLVNDIADDVSDIIGRCLDKTKSEVKEYKQSVLNKIQNNEKDITLFLKENGLFNKDMINYFGDVITQLLDLCGLDSIVLKMVKSSSDRIKIEEKENPYCSYKKRVMILNPPWKANGRRGVRAGSRWPFTTKNEDIRGLPYTPYPFFIGYLSSLLKENGIQSVVVDGVAENLEHFRFAQRVVGYRPRVIVIETSTASYIIDNLWIMKLRNWLPDVKIIVTGPHVSAYGKETIATNGFIDFVVRGEYEIATAELIRCILDGVDYTAIKGLIYRNDDGEIIDNGRPDIIDVDVLPPPERITLPIYNYVDLFCGMKYPSLQVHASRGCPYKCVYCAWPQVVYGNHVYRFRKPEHVAKEILNAIKQFGFKSFYFDDDTFNIGKKRLANLCYHINKCGLNNIPWGAMARADTTDFETLDLMKKAGLTAIKFGVESGNQRLVDNAEKSLLLDRVTQTVSWCRELNILVHLTFTFGLPDETEETIRQTIEFAKKLNPDTAQFSITTPLPGTKYYNELKNTGNLLTTDWERFDGGLYTVIKTDMLSSQQLEDSICIANREFIENKQCVLGNYENSNLVASI